MRRSKSLKLKENLKRLKSWKKNQKKILSSPLNQKVKVRKRKKMKRKKKRKVKTRTQNQHQKN